MFRPAFGRILSRRFFSQAAADGTPSARHAGARLLHLHSQSNVGVAAATTAGHGFVSFRRKFPKGLLGRIVITSAGCLGIGFWCMKKVEKERAERSARPSKVDWVEAGIVSPVVRNQKNCGSCWAMAVVASVEAVHYLNTSQSMSLSVQELIDCNTGNFGCNGGNSLLALWYIWKNGLSSESSYPYMVRRSFEGCKRNKIVAARISGFRFVYWTEDALEKAVAKQPVVVRLQSTDDLRKYKGGIMEHKASSQLRGHYVLIVGYGTDPDGVKYWRFKNSWGKGWGEGGFGRIRRHVADKRGVLGMFRHPIVYPVLNI